MYGGGFATIPAYLADIFGTKYVGGIHGRLLTAWSAAGLIGPAIITKLRNNSLIEAITTLAHQIDPIQFQQHFNAPINQLDRLIEQKIVTISKLMEIAPSHIIDPTYTLYNTTMYTMSSLLAVGFLSNFLMRPVHSKHHMHMLETVVLKKRKYTTEYIKKKK